MKKKEKKVSEYVEEFSKFLREYSKAYQYETSRMQYYDEGSQDLLHQIELGTSKERDKAATLLSHLRKERRVSKNFLEVYEPLYALMQSKGGVEFSKKLSEVLGEIRKIEKSQQNRIYIPRVYQDLEIAMKNTT
jgi:hypothetical protein